MTLYGTVLINLYVSPAFKEKEHKTKITIGGVVGTKMGTGRIDPLPPIGMDVMTDGASFVPKVRYLLFSDGSGWYSHPPPVEAIQHH